MNRQTESSSKKGTEFSWRKKCEFQPSFPTHTGSNLYFLYSFYHLLCLRPEARRFVNFIRCALCIMSPPLEEVRKLFFDIHADWGLYWTEINFDLINSWTFGNSVVRRSPRRFVFDPRPLYLWFFNIKCVTGTWFSPGVSGFPVYVTPPFLCLNSLIFSATVLHFTSHV
jgi:hypothetical protein